jgi:hypothetical protein
VELSEVAVLPLWHAFDDHGPAHAWSHDLMVELAAKP